MRKASPYFFASLKSLLCVVVVAAAARAPTSRSSTINESLDNGLKKPFHIHASNANMYEYSYRSCIWVTLATKKRGCCCFRSIQNTTQTVRSLTNFSFSFFVALRSGGRSSASLGIAKKSLVLLDRFLFSSVINVHQLEQNQLNVCVRQIGPPRVCLCDDFFVCFLFFVAIC